MATTVTKVIDPDLGSGYDYDSLFDWEAAQQGDLTGVRDEIAVAKCRCTAGTADTTAVVITGWTTSATQYVKIWTDPAEGYRHTGTYPSGNKYKLETTNAHGIDNNENYVRIEGIAIKLTATSSGWNCIGNRTIDATGSDIRVDSCIAMGVISSTGACRGIQFNDTDITAYVTNCIVYDFIYSTYDQAGLRVSVGDVSFYNCTVQNCYAGLYQTADTTIAKNCLFAGCTTDISGTVSDTYCATTNDNTKGLTAAGTGNRFSQTFTFVDDTANDFHLAANDTGALGYGLNLYNDATYPFQTDIDGQDRGGAAAAWDIGADQWIPTDSVCWGHDTGVTQENIRNFSGKWYGTGEVLSTGDGERIELASGEYLISEPIIVAADSTVTLRKNSYFMRS